MYVKPHGLHFYVYSEHKIIATVILFYHTSLIAYTVLMLTINNRTHLSNKDAKRRGKNLVCVGLAAQKVF